MSVIGYAQVTANQTGIFAEVDVTGLEVTVDVNTGRYIRITGSYLGQKLTNTGRIDARIREGAALVALWPSEPLGNTDFARTEASVVLTPSAGSHTYRLTLTASSVSAQNLAGAEFPSFIMVEDIGAV